MGSIMIPRLEQLELANEGYDILKEHMICYLAMEERTGKTLTSILIAEMCDNIETVLVVTKKNALEGWETTLKAFPHDKKYRIVNYHQVHKYGRHDMLILDEAHNYISGYPKPSGLFNTIKNISGQIPIIYLSATPHAQGYQMLYHQLALSTWSPWRRYPNFYYWFKDYGIPEYAWFHGRQVPVYTSTNSELVLADIQKLFITKTRKQLNFNHEPVDQVHYMQLDKHTVEHYNELMKDKLIKIGKQTLVCDTSMKLRTSLHMLEGGVAKIGTDYLTLVNDEKIQYILKTWGDTDDLVIYYHYIAEGNKLREVFKKATILQATSYAEGIDLAHKETIVMYSQDFSTAKHTQRRARQSAKHRDKPIVVHFLLVKKAISEQVYNTVSVNKQNFVDSVFERTLL